MALLETNDTIKEYWNEVKDQYPDMSFEQFQTICKNPFRFFKDKIETDEMPTIFIKYFGKFKVFPQTIKALIKKVEGKRKFGGMEEERYNKHMANLTAKLKQLQENGEDRYAKKDSDQSE